MKSVVLVSLLIAAGCLEEAAPEVGEVTQAIVPAGGQGVEWQGVEWQGVEWQGVEWQGVEWQGTSVDGVAFGTTTGSTAELDGTAISVWTRRPDFTWEQRLPDRTCIWNYFRTAKTCTVVNLATMPSPLAGVQFTATFYDPATASTFTRTVQIGASSSSLTAVRADTSSAMFALWGHATSCPIVACENPEGCRANCDIWFYDVRMVEQQLAHMCPTGQALAVAGTYDAHGTRTSTDGPQFTFGCTNGTLAKCTRWGYRPWGEAYKTCKGCTTHASQPSPLADYHQTCVHAAMADYCATGDSFTKTGTLVDVFDWTSGSPYYFIPATKGNLVASTDATALVYEGTFDQYGATKLDHIRYTELANDDVLNFRQQDCLGSFSAVPNDSTAWHRTSGPSPDPTSMLVINSTPACSHTEQSRGKWLHRNCSACTDYIDTQADLHYCTDPLDGRGWDATCASQAPARCAAAGKATMAGHTECATGGSLQLFDSACTAAVCLDPATKSCCAIGKAAWTSTCVSAANAVCKGGLEGRTLSGDVGFCGTPVLVKSSL